AARVVGHPRAVGRRPGAGGRGIAAPPLCPHLRALVTTLRGGAAADQDAGKRASGPHLAHLPRRLRDGLRAQLDEHLPAAGGQGRRRKGSTTADSRLYVRPLTLRPLTATAGAGLVARRSFQAG